MKRFLIPLLLVPSIAMAEVTQTTSKMVGGWQISQHEEDGKFSHCTMGTTFTAENDDQRREMRGRYMVFAIKINRDNMIIINAASPDWQLNTGKNYKLRLDFPNGGWHTFTDVPEKETLLTYFLSIDQTAFDLFKLLSEQRSMRISINGDSLGGFNLVKSEKALDALVECFDMNKSNVPVDPSFGGGQ